MSRIYLSLALLVNRKSLLYSSELWLEGFEAKLFEVSLMRPSGHWYSSQKSQKKVPL